MRQIDVQKRIQSNIIYVNYLDATHNIKRSINYYLSPPPPPPPPDPIRKENHHNFMINSYKNIRRRRKIVYVTRPGET